MPIKIIEARSGKSSIDLIFDTLADSPRGMTVKELSERLNRPVSMVNHYLKSLIALKKISARRDRDRWIYTAQKKGEY